MNLGDLHKVWEIKALKRKPGEEEAKKKILKKIAKQVQPIMCKHKWRVKLLSKFCTIRDALSPIQAVAMAAERRLQDDIWCGSHCSDITGDEESYADTLQDHLDLDQGGERLSINDVSSRHAFGGTSLKQSHGQDKPESSFVDLTTPPVSRSSINEGAKSPKRSCKSNNLIPHQSSSNVISAAPMLNDDSPEN